jgi:hypothetical protein
MTQRYFIINYPDLSSNSSIQHKKTKINVSNRENEYLNRTHDAERALEVELSSRLPSGPVPPVP